MEAITIAYSTLLQLLVKGLFSHIDKTCEIARVVDVRTKTDVYMRRNIRWKNKRLMRFLKVGVILQKVMQKMEDEIDCYITM